MSDEEIGRALGLHGLKTRDLRVEGEPWDDHQVEQIRCELAQASVGLEGIAAALEALPPRLARRLRREAPALTAAAVRRRVLDCDRMLLVTSTMPRELAGGEAAADGG